MAWSTPSTWVAGAVLTAAQLNAQLRDNMKEIGDASTAYTPAWTSSGTNPAIGNGSITGGYRLAGKMLDFWARVVTGSTTTYGSGTYSLSIPAGLTPISGRAILTGSLIDSSASQTYPLFGFWGGSAITLRILPTTAGNPFGAFTPTSPFTLANTDEIFIGGRLEVV